MYKLIAVDLDDTLLNNECIISEENKQAIKYATEKGVIFTIATGRVTKAAVSYAKELNLNVPIITFQGATIHNPIDKTNLYKEHLNIDKIKNIIELAQQNDIHCNLYDNDSIFIRKENKWSEYYKTLSKGMLLKAVGDLNNIDIISTPKMILIDDVEKISQIRRMVENLNIDGINIFTSKPNFLEITSANATKGHALKHYADMFNIKQDEIIAIGDSFNDLTMLEFAGLGICMDNGRPGVKEKADYITSSNEENGVAKAIYEFIR